MLLQGKTKRYAINLDWLSFSGLMDYETRMDNFELTCPEGYRLEVEEHGTNLFSRRAILWNHRGEKMITALWRPKTNLNAFNLVVFEVANRWLYSMDFREVLALTQVMHTYKFCAITRVDICCDFEVKADERRIINGLYYHRYYVANKREGSNFWSNGGDPHDMNWGSKKSDFKWKLYNKSKELKVGTNNLQKPYIVEEWSSLGMKVDKVWRLEVSITKGNALLYEDKSQYEVDSRVDWETGEVLEDYKWSVKRVIDVTDLTNDRFVFRLYYSMLQSRFIIRKKQKHSRKRNDERVFLVDLGNIEDEEKFSVKSYEKNNDDERISLTAELRRLVEQLQSPLARVDMEFYDRTAELLLMMVSKYRLGKYFEREHSMTVREFVDNMREQCGLGVRVLS